MNFNEEKVIELSKRKMMMLGVGALLFVVIGIFMLFGSASSVLAKLAGVASIVFFGACLFVIVKKLYATTPGLIVNHKGITDFSSGVSAGFVPWSEIVEVQATKMGREKFVSIFVTEPERYVQKGNAVQQAAHRANIRLVGTPINISASALKIKHDELVQMLAAYSAEFQNRQP